MDCQRWREGRASYRPQGEPIDPRRSDQQQGQSGRGGGAVKLLRRTNTRARLASLSRSLKRREAQVRTLNSACVALLREGFAARRREVPPPEALMRMHAAAARVPDLERRIVVLERQLAEAQGQARAAVRQAQTLREQLRAVRPQSLPTARPDLCPGCGGGLGLIKWCEKHTDRRPVKHIGPLKGHAHLEIDA